MNHKQRDIFRRTHEWRVFRNKCKQKHHVDFITHVPLERRYNLHHKDLRIEHYCYLDDMDRFATLNEDTHKCFHYLYNFWLKDKRVLSRLEALMEDTYAKTHDKLDEETENNIREKEQQIIQNPNICITAKNAKF